MIASTTTNTLGAKVTLQTPQKRHHVSVCHYQNMIYGGERNLQWSTFPRGASTMRVHAAAAQENRVNAAEALASVKEQKNEGVLVDIVSKEAFDEIVATQGSSLVVLMCKAMGCRPCKMFRKKYEKLAEHFTDAVFCEVVGDRNESTRGMMRSLKIRATPTFLFFRNGEVIHQHSGVNPQKMIDALKVAVQPGEAGYCEELHFVNGVLSEDEE